MAKPTKGSATNNNNNNNKKKPSNNKKKTSSSKNNAANSALKKKWYHTLDQFITETNHMLQLEKSAEEEEALNDTRMKWIEIVNVQSTLNGKYMVQFKFKASDSSSSNSSSSSLYSMKSGQSIQIRMGASKDNPIIGKAINGITTNNTMTYDSSSHSSNSNSNSSNSSSNTRSNTVTTTTTTTDSGGVINSAIMDDFIEEWWESSKLQLIRVPDDVTHKRYTFTLNQKLPQFYNHPIVHTCFTPMNDQDDDDVDDNNNNNNSKNSSSSNSSSTSNDSETREKQGMIEHYMNQDLNQEQKDVVQWSLYQCQSPICCILGPPGTGKTTTLIEIIQQAVSVHRYKVLVCAPSNTAVDNLVTRLSRASRNNNKLKNKVRMIRMGHPARLHDDVTRESLDYVISHGDSAKIVREMRAEIQDVLRSLKRPRRNNSNSSGSNTATTTTTTTTTSRKELVGQLKMLRKDLKKREKLLIQEELRHAQVILCTLTGADDYQLFKSNVEFDLVIVDEAAQSVEIANWIALLKGKRAILAGDPFQLPPTILSTEAQSCGLGVTLFERLYQYYGSKLTRMLTTQYRMHQDIMQWSSQEFYKGQLKAGTDEIAEHLLCDMPLNTSSLDAFASVSSSSSLLTHEKVEETDETSSPLFMIDTGGCGMEESSIEQGESSYNMHEVSLVKHHVKALSDAGVKDYQISIISPYMAQVIALRDALRDEHPFIEVNTVDGFQGRENECVIISMVRSNSNGEVGFLADERRTNVAITRAKRHVCVVCDTTTLRTDSFLSRMASYFSDNADVRSAEDYDV